MSLKRFLHFLQNVIYICALYLLHTVVLSNLCCVVGREKDENVLKVLLKLGGNGKGLGNFREIYMKSHQVTIIGFKYDKGKVAEVVKSINLYGNAN